MRERLPLKVIRAALSGVIRLARVKATVRPSAKDYRARSYTANTQNTNREERERGVRWGWGVKAEKQAYRW